MLTLIDSFINKLIKIQTMSLLEIVAGILQNTRNRYLQWRSQR